jgi:ammonium transporter, Amt family
VSIHPSSSLPILPTNLSVETMAGSIPIAYQNRSSSPSWLNKGDNAWQMTSATLVGLQSMPELVILYGSIVRRNGQSIPRSWHSKPLLLSGSAGSSRHTACPLVTGSCPSGGKSRPALAQSFLAAQSELTTTTIGYHNGSLEADMLHPFYPAATMVYFECMFATITVIILAGSLLGRMNIKAWMAFVPLCITSSYTVCAFSI